MPALGDYLRLFADETRLRILHLLAGEPLTVAELQEILNLSQSSISGHLAKLKHASLIHDLPEGSARRYRLREDLADRLRDSLKAVLDLSREDADHATDRARLEEVRAQRGVSWVDRVAGCLHRAYAPGRTWESLCHGLVQFARFGRCVDVGAGDGSLLELIAPHAESVACIDPSEAMAKAGAARIASLGLQQVRYHLAKAEALPLPAGGSDSVLFLQSLQYVEDPAKALSEAERVLAPGGRLLVLTVAKHQHAEAAAFGHVHHGFAADQLKRWTRSLGEVTTYELPAESKAPHFRTLILTAVKPDGAKPRTRRGN